MAQTDARQGLRVFISYSRKDIAFADRLIGILNKSGFQAYLDKTDIAPGEPWKERLAKLIEGADTVIFVISPDAIQSPICAWEVNEAERLSKRILPVIWRTVLDELVPGRLRRLNYIFLTENSDFSAGFTELEEALLTDLVWVREHTRLAELATRWVITKRNDALLHGTDIAEAERWVSSRPNAAPEITTTQREFIAASRLSREKQLKARAKLRRGLTVVGLLASMVISGLAWFFFTAWQDSQISQSHMLADLARQYGEKGEHVIAMLLALEGLADNRSTAIVQRWRPLVPDAAASLDRAWRENREIVALRGLKMGEWGLKSARFTDGGQRVMIVSHEKERVWDLLTHDITVATAPGYHGSETKLHEPQLNALSPDATRVASATGVTIQLSYAATSKAFAVLKGHEEGNYSVDIGPHNITSVAFSPDGKRLVSVGQDGTARVWNAEIDDQKAVVLRGHNDIVERVAFSPDGKRLVTASWDHTARIWDADTGRQICLLKGHSELVETAVFSPDGRRVVTGSRDLTARIWDVESGTEIVQLRGHEGLIHDARYSPDGQRIITASADGTARIWDSKSGSLTAVLLGHGGEVESAEINEPGTRAVTASDDNTARIWDAGSGKALLVLNGHSGRVVRRASFSPDGKRVLTASADGTARIWEVQTGRPLLVLKTPTNGLKWAAFSPDGRQVLMIPKWPHYNRVSEDPVSIWDALNGKQVADLQGHESEVVSGVFSPDGARVATGSRRDARLWDSRTGQLLAVLAQTGRE